MAGFVQKDINMAIFSLKKDAVGEKKLAETLTDLELRLLSKLERGWKGI